MKPNLADIAYRRRLLLGKIEAQRTEVAKISRRFEKPLAVADAGLKVVRFAQSHPALVAGGIAAVLMLRRRGVIGLVKGGWRLWGFYKTILAAGPKVL